MTKITPKDYNHILSGLEILNIKLSSCEAKIFKYPETSLVISINSKYNISKVDGELYIVSQTFSLKAEKEKETYLYIKCQYDLNYKSKNNLTDSFFEVYKKTGLQTTVWPFFRELVNDITSKMHVPPLVLPLIVRPNTLDEK